MDCAGGKAKSVTLKWSLVWSCDNATFLTGLMINAMLTDNDLNVQ